jgi:hypothetical protein
MILVPPGATAVTTPDALTVAIRGSSDSHVTGHPPAGMGPTVPSKAVNVVCSPTNSAAAVGDTTIEFTQDCGTTVTITDAVFPPAVAMTAATPCARDLTLPAAETTTMEVSLDCQSMFHPPTGGLPVVCNVAVNVLESPSASVVVGATMLIAVTVPGVVPAPGGVVPPVPGVVLVSGGAPPPVAGGVVADVSGGVVVPVPGGVAVVSAGGVPVGSVVPPLGGVVPDVSGPVIFPAPSPPHDTNRATPARTTAATRNRRDARVLGRSMSERVGRIRRSVG